MAGAYLRPSLGHGAQSQGWLADLLATLRGGDAGMTPAGMGGMGPAAMRFLGGRTGSLSAALDDAAGMPRATFDLFQRSPRDVSLSGFLKAPGARGRLTPEEGREIMDYAASEFPGSERFFMTPAEGVYHQGPSMTAAQRTGIFERLFGGGRPSQVDHEFPTDIFFDMLAP